MSSSSSVAAKVTEAMEDCDPELEAASNSFVLAEEAEEAKEMNNKEKEDEMTQSKYAQVVFHDVADRYPNDSDILCRYTFNGGGLNSVAANQCHTSDRVGLYRVPYFAPHDYIAFQWVTQGQRTEQAVHHVVFKTSSLPKDEDFYQFQYLRMSNCQETVIGASIPFQLRSPTGEELCTVEDEEEFMVVRTNTALATEQLAGQIGDLNADNTSLKERVKDYEEKYTQLLDLSEKLNTDLQQKSESFLVLDEQYKSLVSEKDKCSNLLKTDLACVLQAKLGLEERLHQCQKALKTLQTDRDLVVGERDQANRESALLREERDRILSRCDDLKNMLNAVTKSKELAVEEIKAHILKADEHQKHVDFLNKKVAELATRNSDLGLTLNALGQKHEALEQELDQQKKMTQLNQDDQVEKLKAQLNLKEREFNVLSQELVARSKTKFKEVDILKKRLAEAERTLNKYVEGSQFKSAETTEESNNDTDSLPLHIRMSDLEKSVRETRQEIQDIKDDLSSIKGSTVPSEGGLASCMSTSTSTEDSRLLLDDRIITSHLTAKVASETQTEPSSPDSTKDDYLKISVSHFNSLIKGFQEIPESPTHVAPNVKLENTGARPKSKPVEEEHRNVEEETATTTKEAPQQQNNNFGDNRYNKPQRAPSPQIPCSPPTQAPFFRAQQSLFNFLPQFPGSIFSPNNNPQQQPIKKQQMPDPLVPQVVEPKLTPEHQKEEGEESLHAWASKHHKEEGQDSLQDKDFSDLVAWASTHQKEEGQEDFSDLVAWATDSHENNQPTVTEDGEQEQKGDESSVILTDDGRTITTDKAQLSCPVCDEKFKPNCVRELEIHVDSHLTTSLYCPVCNVSYNVEDGRDYQEHVQAHFPEDEDFVQVEQPRQQQQQQQQQHTEETREKAYYIEID